MKVDVNTESEKRMYCDVWLDGIKQEDCFEAYVGESDGECEEAEGRGYIIRGLRDARGKCIVTVSINFEDPTSYPKGFDVDGCWAEIVMGIVKIKFDTDHYWRTFNGIGTGLDFTQQLPIAER